MSPEETRRTADAALFRAHHNQGWTTRFENLRDTIPAILEGAAMAWLVFVMSGGLLLLFWVLAGGGLETHDLVVMTLASTLLATGYLSASRQRQVAILTKALESIERGNR